MAPEVRTVGEALDWTVGYFEDKGVDEPRRSAEWLLSAATGLSRIELYAYRARPLEPDERATYRAGIRRRLSGAPLQYVTGEVPFRSLVLHVEPGVFIPRPETELLVDVGLAYLESIARTGNVDEDRAGGDATARSPVAVDLCAGSGAVAIALAVECPEVRVFATELSDATARVACGNVERSGACGRVEILQGDLFGPLPTGLRGEVDVILANPPYIPSSRMPELPQEVGGFEPALALDGGPEGLDVIIRIAEEAPAWLAPGGFLALEVDESHAERVAGMLGASLEEVDVRRDLAGRDRIVTATKEAGR